MIQLDEVYKAYEVAVKQDAKTNHIKNVVKTSYNFLICRSKLKIKINGTSQNGLKSSERVHEKI